MESSISSMVTEWTAPFGRMTQELGKQVHVARGMTRALWFVAHNAAFFPLVFPDTGPKSTEQELELARRVRELYEADWRNVEDGIYPASLANSFSWRQFALTYPLIAADAPRMRRRMHEGRYDDLPSDGREYPVYYRRNFHFQTEGYLGLGSAARYDSQVEILFGGTADAMRRQVLPPVVRGLAGKDPAKLRILDVACGTGRVLEMLHASVPGAQLYGVDLSPHYIGFARRRLKETVPVSLLVENAEQLPFPDGWFDAITCVYLFHELPPKVRTTVLREMARVLKPGGVLVLEDSIQIADAPILEDRLRHFPVQFHEPFYRHYLTDDLPARMREAGLSEPGVTPAFMSKVWVTGRE